MAGKRCLLTDEISCQWRGERVNKLQLNGQDLLQGVHSEGNIHAWAVGQESCKSSFFKQSKYENLIPVKNSKHIRLHIPRLGYLALDDLLAIYLLHSCWKTEFLLVLQMIKSAHCTITILVKKAVWHVNSTIFLCSYVWDDQEHNIRVRWWKN